MVQRYQSIFKNNDMRTLPRHAGLAALILLMILGYWAFPQPKGTLEHSQYSYRVYKPFPRRIWQKWEVPAQDLDGELQRLSKSWIDLNPGYRYELLTTESSFEYVEDRFVDRPDIVKAYHNIRDGVMRADFIRYLALLADGGVYSDIDSDCSRPIDQWIPEEFKEKAGMVVGIEYDAQGGQIRGDFTLPVQLCQWTIMAKPNHPTLLHVVNRVVQKLQKLQEEAVDLSTLSATDLQETTGPHIFTEAILESLSSRIGRRIDYWEISNMTQPTLFKDVLLLPISAFASGQDHSGSKDWGNNEQLMSHHFLGFNGWKKLHT